VSLIQRNAWTVFVLLSVLLLLIGLSGPEGPTGAGTPAGAFASGDNSETSLALKFRGTVVLGMALFGIAIAVFGLRRQQAWAWWFSWYWPMFFVLHTVAFGTVVPDLPLAIIAALTLLASGRIISGGTS
jgi:hypothetical protein